MRAAVEAVVFDLDGTLVETEAAYRAAFHQALAAVGVAAPQAEFHDRLVGLPRPDRVPLLRAQFGAAFPMAAFFAAYDAARAALLRDGVAPARGAPALLEWLRLEGIACAVATACSRRTAEAHLRHAGLAAHFRVVVTRDEVARRKPHPESFRRAAAALGVAPQRAVAIEDSAPGAAAALAAGMRTVLLARRGVPGAITEGCWAVVDGLQEAGALLRTLAAQRSRAA